MTLNTTYKIIVSQYIDSINVTANLSKICMIIQIITNITDIFRHTTYIITHYSTSKFSSSLRLVIVFGLMCFGICCDVSIVAM